MISVHVSTLTRSFDNDEKSTTGVSNHLVKQKKSSIEIIDCRLREQSSGKAREIDDQGMSNSGLKQKTIKTLDNGNDIHGTALLIASNVCICSVKLSRQRIINRKRYP